MSGWREGVGESRRAITEVFRNPGLRRLNIALVGSVVGDWAYSVAAAVYAYTQGGATAVGVLGVVRYLSMSLVLPFTSSLADKLDRKRLMIASDAIRVALVLIAALVIELDGAPIIVYAIAVLTSLVGTAFRPAQAALMPKLATHPGELSAANVASSTIESVGFFAGPAIGGLLLAVTDIATVYVFDALTFLWSAFVVLGLRVPVESTPAPSADAPVGEESDDHSVGEPVKAPGMFDGLGRGYSTIFRDRDLRLLIGLYCAQTVVAGASLVFSVAIALDLLDLGEAGVGLLNAMVGVGGLIGGFVALMLAQRGTLARDFGLGVIMWAAPLLLIFVWPTLVTSLIAMGLIGLANSVVDVNASTILQRLVPDEVMGRVFGAMDSAVIGGMAIGALLMPILIATIGLRSGLAVIGGAVTVVTLAGLPGLRRIDKIALAPAGLDLLRAVPILGVLPELLLERLARSSNLIAIAGGAAVFSEGDAGDLFYVIESGSVDVTIRGEHIRTLSTGDSFGEIALIRDIPRTATITATSDTVLRAIDRKVFLAAVTGHGAATEQADQIVGRLMAIT